MSTMFDNYPEVTPVDSSTQDTEPSALTEKERKRMKKLNKQLKRQNKVLKEIRNLLMSGRFSVTETPAATKADAAGKKPNSFLNRLGDAVIKAVPAILTTVVTAVLGFFFKGNMGGRDRKPRRATV